MEYILLKVPMYVNWNYTYRCNFNCAHCYSRSRTDIVELTYEDKIRVAKNLIKNRVFNVNLGGGEPLLCEECYDIIRLMVDHGITVNLSSNGWKTTDEQIERLRVSGLRGVSISLDSADESIHDANRCQSGSFKEACSSIKRYVKADMRVFISTTITSANYPVLEDLVKLGVSMGVYGIDFKRLKTMGNAYGRNDLEISDAQRDMLYSYLPIWKAKYPIRINLVYGATRIEGVDAGCPCGKTSLAIMGNGDISPCVYNTYTIGNALKDDLHDIWCNSDALKYLRTNFNCLGLARKVSSVYCLKDGVIFQKDYRIDDDIRIAEYVSDPNCEEIDPEEAIAVVEVNGEPFELNLSGAIILEEILLQKDMNHISGIITELFQICTEKAMASIQTYCDSLIQLGIIERKENK